MPDVRQLDPASGGAEDTQPKRGLAEPREVCRIDPPR